MIIKDEEFFDTELAAETAADCFLTQYPPREGHGSMAYIHPFGTGFRLHTERYDKQEGDSIG